MNFITVPARVHTLTEDGGSREQRIPTEYGSFYARYWNAGDLGWLAFVYYSIDNDVEIHRSNPTLPHLASEEDAITWIQTALDDGPQFLLPLLEAHANG